MIPAASVPQPTAGPALDQSVLDSLRQYDPDGEQGLLVDLVATFEVEARDRLMSLRAAIGLGDGIAAGRLAHSLRGICGAIGATHLAELSRRLELAAGDGHDMRHWDLEPMEREYHRVAAALLSFT
jgi:HPt (histidine-containing phosphotransfer) domain-containing protein